MQGETNVWLTLPYIQEGVGYCPYKTGIFGLKQKKSPKKNTVCIHLLSQFKSTAKQSSTEKSLTSVTRTHNFHENQECKEQFPGGEIS